MESRRQYLKKRKEDQVTALKEDYMDEQYLFDEEELVLSNIFYCLNIIVYEKLYAIFGYFFHLL